MNPSRALAFAAFALTAASATAQTVITSVPYTISASGKYQLGGNLIASSAAQSAITITAPNVILDLNQFFVSGPGNTLNSTASVISVADVSNVTIRNGTVANSGYGIRFAAGTNSINHLVEAINVTRCYIGGVYFDGASAGSSVRSCTLSQIGGSSVEIAGVGINTFSGVRVENNSITGGAVSGMNQVRGIVAGSGVFIIGNTISSCQIGVIGGKYLNNLTSGCPTPFLDGINAVGNN